MAKWETHPTVQRFYEKAGSPAKPPVSPPLDADWLKEACREAGADDVGFVELGRPEMADQKKEALAFFPPAKTLISLVFRMNRENIRTPARSVANMEFHHQTDETNDAARRIVGILEGRGVRAINAGGAGFPMEADRWGAGKLWVLSHKPVAVQAGLGKMGIHRNVIHPRFGNFIVLATIAMEAEVTRYDRPLDYNPCLECKLCVSACPTGAIGADGHFDFAACYTHNYREFMGGFNDWVEKVTESKSPLDYRKKVTPTETVSLWQSLSYGANYKAAYCMAVCPAGEEVISPFLTGRKEFLQEVVKPLQEKKEIIYVVPGSDAEGYVKRRFPHKTVKKVANGLSGQYSIKAFLAGIPVVFQRGA